MGKQIAQIGETPAEGNTEGKIIKSLKLISSKFKMKEVLSSKLNDLMNPVTTTA